MTNDLRFSTYQKAIFEAIRTGSGSIAVNAVAGSGKTTTIVEAAKLTVPTETLFCAFNKHIAGTIAKRLPADVTTKTIHGIGFGTLTAALGRLANPDARKYRALIDEKVFSFAEAIVGDLPRAEDIREIREALGKLVDMARLTLVDVKAPGAMTALADRYGIEAVTPGNSRKYALAVADLLEEGKKLALTQKRIDFTDMVWLPTVLRLRPEQYSVVFVDEAQDLSAAQTALVLSCLRPGGRLIAVGDPKQAIYAFAGADCNSFRKVKAAAKANELPLSVCYRCPTKVLDLARTIVPTIEARPDAPEGIVEAVSFDAIFDSARAGDLILSRKTATLLRACFKFLAKGRAAKVRGREIGKQITAWLEEAGKIRGFRYDALPSYLEKVAARRRAKVADAANAEAKLAAIDDQLEALAVCYENLEASTISGLIARIEDLFADAGNVVWLSTIHRAKGLEADRVFVLEFDRLPMKFRRQSVDEAAQEENLLYIAITRSLRELYLVAPEGLAAERKKAA